MKLKNFLTACAGLLMVTSSCSGSKKAENAETVPAETPKVLVTYFSATGTTRAAAERLAKAANATLFEITPAELYTDADLDWRNQESRSTVEMRNRDSRPALAGTVEDIDSYDIIFIGYPNWWNTAPTIINTFIESINLDGRTVVPFMTSGGNDITNSEKDLREAYPGINWKKGLLMNDVTDREILEWIDQVTSK